MYEKQDVEALERRFGWRHALTGLHPDFQAQVKAIFLEGKSYKGVRGFLNWRSDMEELFEQERFLPVGIRFAGKDRWVVLGRLHIAGEEGGVELDVPLAHVVEQRDRKVARLTIFSDISESIESVGLYA